MILHTVIISHRLIVTTITTRAANCVAIAVTNVLRYIATIFPATIVNQTVFFIITVLVKSKGGGTRGKESFIPYSIK